MGSAGYELLDQDAATSSTSVRAGGARIVVSSGLSTNSGAVNSQQTDDADRLAAAAEEVGTGL